jgi:DNA-binding transcriptional MerR regulator
VSDGVDAAFLSIGEVLDVLKVDFPDVTISKIRFLESQGLVDPERTASGYRKFYDADVERLRWILRQQREHFLPLKVIKDRLERDGDAYLRGPAELHRRRRGDGRPGVDRSGGRRTGRRSRRSGFRHEAPAGPAPRRAHRRAAERDVVGHLHQGGALEGERVRTRPP